MVTSTTNFYTYFRHRCCERPWFNSRTMQSEHQGYFLPSTVSPTHNINVKVHLMWAKRSDVTTTSVLRSASHAISLSWTPHTAGTWLMEVGRVPLRPSRTQQSSDFSHLVGSQFQTDVSEEPRCQPARKPGVTAQKNKSERRLVLEFVDKGTISLLYLWVWGGGAPAQQILHLQIYT
jgi:hypothetical protein